jgi:DNA transformation protein and related proteins
MKAKTKGGLMGTKNIGITLSKKLYEIGVYSVADLQQMGAAKAYLKIKENNPNKTISICYYLYSFEGALLDLHWDDIPKRRKQELLKAIGK